jgi:hypothetical protein
LHQLLRRALALAPLLLLMAACEPVYPPIAAGVAHDSEFKYLIATRYGPGTPAAVLRAELAGEGFVFTAGEVPGFRYSATKGETNLPCFSYVRVDWNEDRRGRISLVQASRLQCR